MLFKQLFDQDTWTYTYLLADPGSREAIIIDPVVERVDRDLKLIAELGLELVYTLDTHVHADHVTGSGELRNRTGALSGVASVAEVACVDRNLIHGDVLRFGRYALEVRSTPGHTNGCLTFVVETSGQTLAFTGDALFIRGCGRTDFQQGDAATLYSSVHGQIFSLPEDTIVYPGHDYRGHTMSTVAEEKAHNPRLNIDITGDEAHAGTTPRRSRRDAMSAAVAVVGALQQLAEDDDDILRFTVGRFRVSPGSPNTVPGHVHFTIDLRHPDAALLTELGDRIHHVARDMAAPCAAEITDISFVSPTRFPETIVSAVRDSAVAQGFTVWDLPSGAGHDAMHLARICPTGMIFVPCLRGISHNPAESATPEDLAKGACVLADTLVRLAQD